MKEGREEGRKKRRRERRERRKEGRQEGRTEGRNWRSSMIDGIVLPSRTWPRALANAKQIDLDLPARQICAPLPPAFDLCTFTPLRLKLRKETQDTSDHR
jgi:hypothetical protein